MSVHLLVAGKEPPPHPVPLGLLHLLRLPLGGENQTGTKGGYSPLPDGLFGVPHSHKNVVEEGLHLLEEEGGDADCQLTENQNLGEEGTLRTLIRNTASRFLEPIHVRKEQTCLLHQLGNSGA